VHRVLRPYVQDAVSAKCVRDRELAADVLARFSEMTNRRTNDPNTPDYYEQIVPGELAALELSEQEWTEFRSEILGMIPAVEDPNVRSSLIWAITLPPSWQAVDTVVPLLNDHRCEYSPGQVGSLLYELDYVVDILSSSAEANLAGDEQLKRGIAHVDDVLHKFEVSKMLDELAAAADWRISLPAQQVREHLAKWSRS
jgi:hypothetical protein